MSMPPESVGGICLPVMPCFVAQKLIVLVQLFLGRVDKQFLKLTRLTRLARLGLKVVPKYAYSISIL